MKLTRDHLVAAWDYLQGGQVTRFHTLPNPPRQTTAEHSGRVALLAWIVSNGRCSARLLAACLVHDLPEALTGDVPAPTKWANAMVRDGLSELESRINIAWPVLRVMDELTEDEADLLALCDALDGMFTCVQAARDGHNEIHNPFDKWMEYCRAQWPDVEDGAWAYLQLAMDAPKARWNPWRILDGK